MASFDATWENRHKHRFNEFSPSEHGLTDRDLKAAQALYKLRRQRELIFGIPDLFADPAWDILLAMVIDQAEGRATSVNGACISACIPLTTALRVVGKLGELELIVRAPDPFDKRRFHLNLTPKAWGFMARVLKRA